MRHRKSPGPVGPRAWLLPLSALVWNMAVYRGAHWIAQDWPHMDWTLPIDRAVPFLPWTIVIYYGCYLFWAAVYLFCARQEKALAGRFFRADFLAKAVCFACFLLLPTTNVRPAVEGTGLWESLMRLLYRIDAPTNLFPSIHCLVSWLCWIGVRDHRELSPWLRRSALFMAVAVCISTLTTRQHVILDVAAGILLAELSWYAAARRGDRSRRPQPPALSPPTARK